MSEFIYVLGIIALIGLVGSAIAGVIYIFVSIDNLYNKIKYIEQRIDNLREHDINRLGVRLTDIDQKLRTRLHTIEQDLSLNSGRGGGGASGGGDTSAPVSMGGGAWGTNR
jgi:uncharacterized membrane protein YgcG